jgi:hypothetical protein
MRDRYLVNGAVNKLTAHRPRAFAHIVFESGEHVLVSCKQTGIRISRLWFGVVPVRKICDWPRSNPKLLDDALKFFMAGPDSELPGGTILELIASRLMNDCRSIADVKRLCHSLRPAAQFK